MDKNKLAVDDVVRMPIAEFETRFNFRPVDALEKKWFAITGERLSEMNREMVEAGLLGDINTSNVNMKEEEEHGQ